MKITDLAHFMTNIHDSLSFYVIFSCFSDLGVLARAGGALRDPRKIFSTSNLRLVKKVAARRKKHLRTTIYENHKIAQNMHILRIQCHFV